MPSSEPVCVCVCVHVFVLCKSECVCTDARGEMRYMNTVSIATLGVI